MTENSFKIGTPLGIFTCHFTEKGITGLDFPKNSSAITKSLPISAPFDRSKLIKDLRLYLEGKPVSFSYPLDLSALTAFQKSVCTAIAKIPYGRTVSYKQLAGMAGAVKSFRAAGSACGKNPVPILIPCHRVVRSDGGLGGFSGGLNWKKALLEIEKTLR